MARLRFVPRVVGPVKAGAELAALAVLAAAALAVAVACEARAWADAGDLVVDVEPGYAALLLPGPSGTVHGGGLGAGLALGLSDSLWVRGGASGAMLSQSTSLGSLSVGVVYGLDVLRTVPLLELGLAAVHRDGPSSPSGRFDLAGGVGLGFDYLVTERWGVGAMVRYLSFLTETSSAGRGYVGAGARLTYRFLP